MQHPNGIATIHKIIIGRYSNTRFSKEIGTNYSARLSFDPFLQYIVAVAETVGVSTFSTVTSKYAFLVVTTAFPPRFLTGANAIYASNSAGM